MSNLEYVRDLISGEAPDWVAKQLAGDLDEKDREIEQLRKQLAQTKDIPDTVTVRGMYDCHLFHRYRGKSPREIANNWVSHNKEPHLALFEGESEPRYLGPTCLGPAIVLSGKKELRRVGHMVFTRGEYPDVTYNEADLEKWISALEADPDISRILAET